jgi:hypothetical protein
MQPDKRHLLGLVGSAMLLAGTTGVQSAAITAAAAFDLTSLTLTNASFLAPAAYDASAEVPFARDSATGIAPVSASADSNFFNGSALAVADVADTDPLSVLVSADAFDAGDATANAAWDFGYEVISDGTVSIEVDYEAFYDLDGSTLADSLISLMLLDSLSGDFDEFALLPGDPDAAFGTLSVTFDALAGDAGIATLLAGAGVDTGVMAQVPGPATPVLLALGLVPLLCPGQRRTA